MPYSLPVNLKIFIDPFYVNDEDGNPVPDLVDADFTKLIRRDGQIIVNEAIPVRERADLEPGWYDAYYIAQSIGHDEITISHPTLGLILLWTNSAFLLIDKDTGEVVGVDDDLPNPLEEQSGGPYPDGIWIKEPFIIHMHDDEDLFN
jgi:hypothetical protein